VCWVGGEVEWFLLLLLLFFGCCLCAPMIEIDESSNELFSSPMLVVV